MELERAVRIYLKGEFDIAQEQHLTELLAPAIGQKNVVLDLSETSYIDSTALSCMIRLARLNAPTNGVIAIAGANRQVRRIIQIAKLDEIFEILDA